MYGGFWTGINTKAVSFLGCCCPYYKELPHKKAHITPQFMQTGTPKLKIANVITIILLGNFLMQSTVNGTLVEGGKL